MWVPLVWVCSALLNMPSGVAYTVERLLDNTGCASHPQIWKKLEGGGNNPMHKTSFQDCAQKTLEDPECGDTFWVKHCDNCGGKPCSMFFNSCALGFLHGDISCACVREGRNPICNTQMPFPGWAYGRIQRGPEDPNYRGQHYMAFGSGKLTRTAILHVPPNITNRSKVPLVFSFHGWMANAYSQMYSGGFNDDADESGYAVVYPQGYYKGSPYNPVVGLMGGLDGYSWNAGGGMAPDATGAHAPDVQFAKDLLVHVSQFAQENGWEVDANRVYAYGFSNGAFLVNRMRCEAPEMFAAVAGTAGTLATKIPFGSEAAIPCPTVLSPPLPLLYFHGTADNVIGYSGSLWGMGAEKFIALERQRNQIGEDDAGNHSQHGKGDCVTYGKNQSRIVFCSVHGMGHVIAGSETDYEGVEPCGPPCDVGIDTGSMVFAFFNQFQRSAAGLSTVSTTTAPVTTAPLTTAPLTMAPSTTFSTTTAQPTQTAWHWSALEAVGARHIVTSGKAAELESRRIQLLAELHSIERKILNVSSKGGRA